MEVSRLFQCFHIYTHVMLLILHFYKKTFFCRHFIFLSSKNKVQQLDLLMRNLKMHLK